MSNGEPKLGDVVGDKYELQALIGRGGMGAVFRARHRITDRTVALKWLLEDDPQRRARFLREAKAMGRLSHPNVIGVLDVGDHEGAIFLVMDYLEGKSLREVMDGIAFPAGEAIALLMPALAGVAAAHRAKILHRDLKPENLFVLCDESGHPYDTKVLDFGVAKPVHDDAGPVASLTHSGVIVGTPRYMAPEQLGDAENLDARADIYSLGVILFELLIGRLPYRAKSLNGLLLEIMTGKVQVPRAERPDLPEGLCEVIEKALERELDERFVDVASFARALEPFGDGARFEAPRRVNTPKNTPVRRVARLKSSDEETVEPLHATLPAKRSNKTVVLEPPATLDEPASVPPSPKPRSLQWMIGGLAVAVLGGIAFFALGNFGEEPVAPAPVQTTIEAPVIPTPTPPVEAPRVEAPETVEPQPLIPVPAAPRVEAPRAFRTRRTITASEPSPTAEPAAEPRQLRVQSRAGALSQDDF